LFLLGFPYCRKGFRGGKNNSITTAVSVRNSTASHSLAPQLLLNLLGVGSACLALRHWLGESVSDSGYRVAFRTLVKVTVSLQSQLDVRVSENRMNGLYVRTG